MRQETDATKGINNLPYTKQKAALIKIAKALRKQGYSMPQIAVRMGYKTARSVQMLLEA